MKPVTWHLLYGGACTHPEKVVNPTSSFKNRVFPALFALIEHPDYGPVLFDTGYASRFFTETNPFPYRIYRMITPVMVQPEDEAVQQVKQLGYQPEEIKWIILSHLHADHIAGVRDFPQAQILCTSRAWNSVKNKSGIAALKKGMVPQLLPDNFSERLLWIDNCATLSQPFTPFEIGYDLFGDQSLIAVDLPGHAAGQIGLFLQNQQGKITFLAADSCWTSQAYQELMFPHRIANLINDDPQAYQTSLTQVHQLSKHHPDIEIIPSHCLETWTTYREMQEKTK
ncbi:MBL fold metallo-hydrolase [Hazenella coriacea]|uniref:Metallo-beta-lactamase superfamily protein n=1 Tax=Hazenella coriacea TaxID=1179467 RepID=A0A4R3LC28_9BACL|nr:MBL fold metallo-hydrolase [Hazenella coriacea]TCS96858.1 metallo-beta-lactamase superfamily protein [Hazenella coriacea]